MIGCSLKIKISILLLEKLVPLKVLQAAKIMESSALRQVWGLAETTFTDRKEKLQIEVLILVFKEPMHTPCLNVYSS